MTDIPLHLKDTHLLEWLGHGYDHCQHGSKEWCQSYLNSARNYIIALEKASRQQQHLSIMHDAVDNTREKEINDFLHRLGGLIEKNEKAFQAALVDFKQRFNDLHGLEP